MLNEGIIAAIAAGLGGIGLKVAEATLGRKDKDFDQASRIRTELRQDVDALRKRLIDVEAEVERYRTAAEVWRLKSEEQQRRVVQLIDEVATLKEEVMRLRLKYEGGTI